MPSKEEHEQVLAEELEVLESIYIDELERLSSSELKIRIEPEDDVIPSIFSIGLEAGVMASESVESGSPKPVEIALYIKYTEEYPDAPPEMRIHIVRDTKGVLGPIVDEDENDATIDGDRESVKQLLQGLDQVAQESLGMAMVFTLASHLRESLTEYIQNRIEQLAAEDNAKREEEIEAEAEKFRGTSVTTDRFYEWRKTFEAEMIAEQLKEEKIKMAKMSPREREDYKKAKTKPSGRQLFERGDGVIEEEDKEDEEGAQEVDWSLYTREQREKERREEEERRELENRTDGLAFEDDEDQDE